MRRAWDSIPDSVRATPPNTGMKHETEILIEAPVCEVWAHLVDFDRHSEWSDSFVLRACPAERARGRVHFELFGRRMSHPIVLEVVAAPNRLQWCGGPKGLFCGSHYFELEPARDRPNATRLRHGEEFRGLAVPLLWPLLAHALGPAYESFNRQLKQRVEASASGR
jgi:hypothetical protein